MAVTTAFPRAADAFGCLQQSSHIDAFNDVTVAQSILIPANARFVLFSATGSFYAKIGGSGAVATVVSAGVTDGSGSMCNPTFRLIPVGATHISVVAASAVDISLEYFAKPAF